MAILTPPSSKLPSVFISTYSKESLGQHMRLINPSSAFSSQVWATANRAIYVPFTIREPILVKRMFVLNGTTAGGTNTWDIGIYMSALGAPTTRLVSSGTTATSGTSQAQFFDVADTLLPEPGLYFMALVMSGTTDHSYRTNVASIGVQMGQMGIFGQTTASPLPTTATPVATANANSFPIFGLTTRAAI